MDIDGPSLFILLWVPTYMKFPLYDQLLDAKYPSLPKCKCKCCSSHYAQHNEKPRQDVSQFENPVEKKNSLWWIGMFLSWFDLGLIWFKLVLSWSSAGHELV